MELIIMVNGLMEWNMVMVFNWWKMEIFMKVNFLKIKDMAKENIFGKIKIIS